MRVSSVTHSSHCYRIADKMRSRFARTRNSIKRTIFIFCVSSSLSRGRAQMRKKNMHEKEQHTSTMGANPSPSPSPHIRCLSPIFVFLFSSYASFSTAMSAINKIAFILVEPTNIVDFPYKMSDSTPTGERNARITTSVKLKKFLSGIIQYFCYKLSDFTLPLSVISLHIHSSLALNLYILWLFSG